jgi:hypothetical protein
MPADRDTMARRKVDAVVKPAGGYKQVFAVITLGAFASLVLAAGVARSDAEEAMPAARFATFLARLLAYDASFKARVGASVDIAVLYDAGDAASTQAGTSMAAATKTLELTRILDLPVVTRSLPVNAEADLDKAVARYGIDTFIVCPGLDKKQPWIKSVSEKHKVVSVGVSGAQVRAGLAIAVFLDDGKSKILVNLPASKKEGVMFSSDLLRLSEVIQ